MERSIDSAGLFIGVLGGADRRTDQESQHKSCLIEIFPTASSVDQQWPEEIPGGEEGNAGEEGQRSVNELN